MNNSKQYSTTFEFEYWSYGSNEWDAARISAEKFIADINKFGVDFLLDYSKTIELHEIEES